MRGFFFLKYLAGNLLFVIFVSNNNYNMELDKLLEESENWENVRYRMETEGIEYCFTKYSSFEEIQDEEFHLKRKKLIGLMWEMRMYIQDKITETEDKISDIDNEDEY